MTMITTLSDYAQRSKRAAEVDGLNDITGGTAFLAITLMEYTSILLQGAIRGSNFQDTYAYKTRLMLFVIATIAMFAIIVFTKRGAKSLRERFVYPRVGYVAQPLEPPLRKKFIRIAVFVAATVLIGATMTAVARASGPLPVWNNGLLVVIAGAGMAGSYFFQFAKLGFIRHLVLGGVAVLTSLLLAIAHLDDLPALGLLTITLGVSLIVAGTITFRNLLQTPVFVDGEAE